MKITILIQQDGSDEIKKVALSQGQRNVMLQALNSAQRGQIRTTPEVYRLTINHKAAEADAEQEETPAPEEKPKRKGGRRRKNPLPETEDAPEDLADQQTTT